MSERKWRPVGDRPVIAGDAFGDFQVGEAFVVTYHLDGAEREYQGEMVPMVRVSAYFGVERQQNAGGALPAEPTRYSPVSRIYLERLDVYGEVIEEVDTDGEQFPFDWPTAAQADADMRDEMWSWQKTVWGVSDFWDGKDMPRD